MSNQNTKIAYAKNHPIIIGLFAVLATIVAGIVVAYAMGFTSPTVTKAFDILPPCCTIPPPPPLPPPPAIIPPVIIPDILPPCCTEAPVPTVPPPTVIPPVTIPDILPPCCTVPVTTPPVVLPPVIVPPVIIPPIIIPPVTPPGPVLPVCTLTASPTAILAGGSSTLSWTTTNAETFSIDQGIGMVTPVAGGTRVVSPTTGTAYTGTATGPGGVVHCTATVTISTTPPPGPDAPVCTLIAGPTSIQVGGTSVLTWTTANATSFTLNNAIGAVTPVSAGTHSVSPSTTTTYTGIATGPGGSVSCAATVTVTTTPPVPVCLLTASPTAINSGDAVTLSYSGTNISTVVIDNGVGTTTSTSGTATVHPTSNTTYTGTFTATNGQILTCTAGVTINTGGGGGGGGSSGGGGGGSRSPKVTLDVFPQPQVLGAISLSQIPYTGLELGTIGTIIYWTMLVLWSAAAAYLLLFTLIPQFRRARNAPATTTHGHIGVNSYAPVPEANLHMHQLNQHIGHEQIEISHGAVAHVAPVASVQAVPTPAEVHGNSSHAVHTQAPASNVPAHEGFRAFAQGDTLTIDDIVKGLSRESGMVFSQSEPLEYIHHESPMTFHDEQSAELAQSAAAQPPIARSVSPMPIQTPAIPTVSIPPTQYSDNIAGFLTSLLSGDRDAVFGAVRGVTSSGGNAEEFLSHAVCALDDAYRARTDGTQCHPEIARITADLHTTFLEKLVTSLATAVDSSYSAGITGTKLALTRALSIVNG